MPRRSVVLPLAAVAALALWTAACGGDRGAFSGGRLDVVATTTQVADLAQQVAGDRAQVTGVLTPNADPHDYEPRPSDARAIAGAGVILRSGGEVDAWLADVIEAAGSHAPTVDLIDAVPHRREDDPHWWQDPRDAEAAVRAIAAALAKADPGGRVAYERNADRYLGRLRALDGAIAACMASIPAARRKLVSNHDALGYFAERYDIAVVGAVIPALSTQARPSAGATQALVRTIRREGVTTIFPESSVNPRLERAIAEEAGARVGRELWADALGPKGSDGATYLASLRSNALALADGFTGGQARCTLPR